MAGFFLTYTLPLATGSFQGPRSAHIHGALLFGWLIVTVVQTRLIGQRIALHRTIGWTALVLAPLVAVSTIWVGYEGVAIGLARGDGQIAISGFLGTVTSPLIYLSIVFAAIAMRSDPQWHKRLMLIATVAILWPAWFRFRHFLPGLPRPEITLSLVAANLPIGIAMFRDRIRFGKIHPAYLWIGLGLIAEQTFETVVFDSPAWRSVARALYSVPS
ncbi:hypothetical protein GRI40_07565 [Altererythrobacter aerius]|uniref:Uncharacterized protein n=1 Tax=Tsuneonella aeria TaxID=1837929 RepID=A0A6I4TCL3_9SPHN|nr:hypothetical protein [Tsuneonella aeria]MXO75071.1 hypothetical protein [Tsuneonella aeria]